MAATLHQYAVLQLLVVIMMFDDSFMARVGHG